MNKQNSMIFIAAGLIASLLVGCTAAPVPVATSTPAPTLTSTPEPTATPKNTATPAPTATLTPAPILGIDEPILVNDINVQVLAAKWGKPQLATGFCQHPNFSTK